VPIKRIYNSFINTIEVAPTRNLHILNHCDNSIFLNIDGEEILKAYDYYIIMPSIFKTDEPKHISYTEEGVKAMK